MKTIELQIARGVLGNPCDGRLLALRPCRPAPFEFDGDASYQGGRGIDRWAVRDDAALLRQLRAADHPLHGS